MLPSEIDDIFASKRKVQITTSSVSSSSLPEKKGKRKKRKKPTDPTLDTPVTVDKRATPEIVIDPSVHVSAGPVAKKAKLNDKSDLRPKQKKGKIKDADREEEQRFKDSRGSGPRRKTEEGYSIYKEDELGIQDEGGDTPLCPFDCQCCMDVL